MLDLDDDEDDALLFDTPDEADAINAPTNLLIVPARPPSPEMLSALEQEFRSIGLAPCVFIEDDDTTGQPYLGNAVALGKAMGLPADVLPNEQQFDEWAARRPWASWNW